MNKIDMWKWGAHWGVKCGAAMLVASAMAMPAHALDVGQSVPAISLNKMGGGAINANDMKGGVVYLDFWASWCALINALSSFCVRTSAARICEPETVSLARCSLT